MFLGSHKSLQFISVIVFIAIVTIYGFVNVLGIGIGVLVSIMYWIVIPCEYTGKHCLRAAIDGAQQLRWVNSKQLHQTFRFLCCLISHAPDLVIGRENSQCKEIESMHVKVLVAITISTSFGIR